MQEPYRPTCGHRRRNRFPSSLAPPGHPEPARHHRHARISGRPACRTFQALGGRHPTGGRRRKWVVSATAIQVALGHDTGSGRGRRRMAPGRGPTVASAGDADGTAGRAVTAGAVLGRGQRPEDAESGRRGGPDGCIGRTKPIAQRPDSNPVPAWDFSKPGIRRAVPGHDPYAPDVRTPPYRTDTDPMATPQASGAVSKLPPMAAGDHPPLESPFTSGHCPACRTFRRNFP